MVIVQDREGDIYEQFAVIPDEQTGLLIRARANRTLKDKTKLLSCLSDQQPMGTYKPVVIVETAKLCIEWYSWRWMIEEVFKILKKEGYNIEASELEYASSVRKLCLLIMEVK